MTTIKDKIIEAGFADHIFSDIDLKNLFNGTPAARYGMVNKALKKSELIKIRRGLYILSEKYRHKKLSKFFLASRIVPHSYISLESALSYHGWIPEHVSTVTSVLAFGRTKKFTTYFGDFTFYYLPINKYEFLTGIDRVEEVNNEPFLIASPLRALADLVYIKKIDWQGLDLLINSFRIEREQLMKIQSDHFFEIKKIYRSTRVLKFFDKLSVELKKCS